MPMPHAIHQNIMNAAAAILIIVPIAWRYSTPAMTPMGAATGQSR